jgi:hypothetical protein
MPDSKRLTNLRVAEVSLVGKPANKRRFLLAKSMEGGDYVARLSAECKALMKACMRKLEPYRDQLDGLFMGMDSIVRGEAFDMSKMMPGPSDVGVPSTQWEKDMNEGLSVEEAIQRAFESGRRFGQREVHEIAEGEYPDGMMEALFDSATMLKAYKTDLPEELFMAYKSYLGDGLFEMAMDPVKAMRKGCGLKVMEKGEDTPPGDIRKGDTEQMSDDKTKLDLSTLPPEVQAQIDSLFKSQEEAVKKAAELEAVLKEERDKRLTEEALAIAKGFSHLPIKAEEFGPVVKALREKAPQEWAEVMKALTAADTAIGEGKLFDEVGTTTSPKASSVMGQINALADGLVQKSEIKLTREQAVDQVLKSNPDLYNEYLKELGQ